MQKIIHWSFKLINLLLKGEITLTFPPYKYVKKFEITVYDKKDVKKSFLYELLIYRRLYYDVGFIFFSVFFKNDMKICTLYRYVCTGM